MSGQGFFDSLEAQLGTGLDRATARRRTRRHVLQRAGASALALDAVDAVSVLLQDDAAEAGVSVERRDGLVYVRLIDIEYRPDVIEDAARRAGLDITVDAVPAGPSLVGRFVGFEQAGEDTGILEKLDADGPAFAGFAIPAGYEGTLVLQVGRPADGDEPYLLFSNALAEGEPLACTGIVGAAPARASEIAGDRDVEVRWSVVTDGGFRPVELSELTDGERDRLRVRRAESIAPDVVTILLSEEATSLPPIEHTADAIC